MRAASRNAIPCLRTLTAFFAGSHVNRIRVFYEMYLRMSRCEVLRRDRISATSHPYGGSFHMMMVPEAREHAAGAVADRDLGAGVGVTLGNEGSGLAALPIAPDEIEG